MCLQIPLVEIRSLAASMEEIQKKVFNDFDAMVGPMMLGSFYPKT